MTANPDNDRLRHYRALRRSVGGAGEIAVLHVGAERTTIAVGSDSAAAVLLELCIGSAATARQHFRHLPPTPLELENAIAAVEDELARARGLIPADVPIYSADAELAEIAQLSGVALAPEMQLRLAAVEQSFARLAAVVLGSPAAQQRLPHDAGFAARLLIVREFMHHLQVTTLLCRAAQGEPSTSQSEPHAQLANNKQGTEQ